MEEMEGWKPSEDCMIQYAIHTVFYVLRFMLHVSRFTFHEMVLLRGCFLPSVVC